MNGSRAYLLCASRVVLDAMECSWVQISEKRCHKRAVYMRLEVGSIAEPQGIEHLTITHD